MLGERLGVPVYVDNDVNALALAEWTWGAGRGARSLVMLALGTGVGGGHHPRRPAAPRAVGLRRRARPRADRLRRAALHLRRARLPQGLRVGHRHRAARRASGSGVRWARPRSSAWPRRATRRRTRVVEEACARPRGGAGHHRERAQPGAGAAGGQRGQVAPARRGAGARGAGALRVRGGAARDAPRDPDPRQGRDGAGRRRARPLRNRSDGGRRRHESDHASRTGRRAGGIGAGPAHRGPHRRGAPHHDQRGVRLGSAPVPRAGGRASIPAS